VAHGNGILAGQFAHLDKSQIMSIDPFTTRRRFLEQLGLVGGSSLVMTALQSWDLMAGQAGSRPALSGTGSPANKKVLVLGAGVSGLVLGYELGRLGYDYQILEGRDRAGGLCWTARHGTEHVELNGERQVCTYDEGLYTNCGPWRIPYTHTGVLGYCRELGVGVEMFINESDNSYFYYEGAQWGPLAGKRTRLRQVKADMIGWTNELIVKALDQKKLDLPLEPEDKDRFVRFLVNAGYLDSTEHAYKGFPPADRNPPLNLSAILRAGFDTRVRSAPSSDGTAAAPIFQPVGGMDQFPKALERAIGPRRITFNADVQSVHQDETGVKVVYKDGKSGRRHELTADYVALCLPMSVVAKMDVNLSEDVMKIVKTVNHSESAKVGLAMRRRFWEEDDAIFGGHLYSNLPLGEFSYPSTGYFSKKGVLLGLYINGSTFNPPTPNPAAGRGRGAAAAGAEGRGRGDAPAGADGRGRGAAAAGADARGRGGAPVADGRGAARGAAPAADGRGGRGGESGAPAERTPPPNTFFADLGKQPIAARVEHVLYHASKVHPQIRTEHEGSFAVWWKNVKFSEGGYASGLAAERRQQISKIDNRIIIGSAVTCPSSAPDWQEGAVAAGWQALKTLHERAMRG
jgi:monoamine oxidase